MGTAQPLPEIRAPARRSVRTSRARASSGSIAIGGSQGLSSLFDAEPFPSRTLIPVRPIRTRAPGRGPGSGVGLGLTGIVSHVGLGNGSRGTRGRAGFSIGRPRWVEIRSRLPPNRRPLHPFHRRGGTQRREHAKVGSAFRPLFSDVDDYVCKRPLAIPPERLSI